MEEDAASDAAILRNLRSQLAETPDDDTPVAAVVEQKKKWTGMLTNKLNACTSTLPTPDVSIVKQIAIFAEMQINLFRDEAVVCIVKDILRTSRYSKGMKLQSSDIKNNFPLQALCASILHDLNENIFEWPTEFIEIYLEDALGARMWVDAVQASAFCECITKKYVPQTPAASMQKAYEDEESDSSSGDEEVLEDSAAAAAAKSSGRSSSDTPSIPGPGSSIASNGKSTIYRFPGNHSDAQLVIKSKIESRVGISDGQVTSSGTWSMIETMKTFCHLSSVRLIASKCVDKWILNPALAEQVKDLVRHLTECLEVLDEKSGSSSSGHLSGSLTSSDMSVVESIVMLRSKLKAQSQIEVYRAILISIVNKGSAVARSVIKLFIVEDLRTGGMKPETLKYITNLLLSIRSSSSRSINKNDGTDEEGKRSGCIIFAEAIRDICTNSEHWSSMQSKIIIELVAKILRSMDMVKVDVASFIGALLGNTYSASMTLYHGWNDGSNELFKFYSEIIVAIQLLVTHEICAPRKSEHMGGSVPSEVHGHNPLAHKSSSVGGRVGGRGGGLGRGDGITLGGRGGGRLGAAPSGMFVGKKSSNIPAKKTFQPENNGSTPVQSSSSASASNQASIQTAVDTIELIRKNLAIQETALSWFHQVFAYYSKLPSREIRDENAYALDWICKVLCTRQTFISTILDKIVDKNAAKYVSEQCYLSSKVLIAVIDVIKMTVRSLAHLTSGFDCIEQLVNRTLNRPPRKLGHSSSSANLSQMVENGGSNGAGNEKSSSSNYSGSSKDGDDYYIEISDHTVVDKLFELCVVRLQKMNSNRTLVSSSTTYETSELEANRRERDDKEITIIESNTGTISRDRSYSLGSNDGLSLQDSKIEMIESEEPIHPLFDMPGNVLTMDLDKLPKFGLKSLYWRACILCFTLGCLKPDTVGNFVWKNIATVRALMLMVMSDRDYFVPIAETVHMGEAIEPQNSEMRSYTYKGAVLDVTPYGVRVNKSADTRSIRISHTDTVNETCISRLEKELWTHITKHDKLLRIIDTRHKRTVSTRSSDHEAFLDDESDNENEDNGDDIHVAKKMRVDSEAKTDEVDIDEAANDSSGNDDFNKMEVSGEPSPEASKESMSINIAVSTATSQSSSSAEGCESADVSMDLTPGGPNSELETSMSMSPPKEDIDRFQIAYTTKAIGKLTTSYGKLTHTDIVILSTMGAAREPPGHVISAVNYLEEKHKFGARLRGSDKPDFISRAIVGDQDQDSIDRNIIEQSANWLIPAIAVDAHSAIERIPVVAAAHLYLVVGAQICRELSSLLDWRSESFAVQEVDVPPAYAKYKQVDKEIIGCITRDIREIVDVSNLNLYIIFAKKIVEIFQVGATEVAGNALSILLEDLHNKNLERRETCRMSLTIVYKLYEISDVNRRSESELLKVVEDTMMKGPMSQDFLGIVQKLPRNMVHTSFVDILRSIIKVETAHRILIDCFTVLQKFHDGIASHGNSADTLIDVLISFISERGVFASHLFCTQPSLTHLLYSLTYLETSLVYFKYSSTALGELTSDPYIQTAPPELMTEHVLVKVGSTEMYARKDFIKSVFFIGALYLSELTSLFHDRSGEELGNKFVNHCISILECLSGSDQLNHFHTHILLFRKCKLPANDGLMSNVFTNIKSHKLLLEIISEGCNSQVFAICQKSMDTLLRSNRNSVESWVTKKMISDPSLIDILRSQMSSCVQLGIDVDTIKAKEKEEKEKEKAEKVAEKAALVAEKAAEKAMAAVASAPAPTRVSTRERVPTTKFAESVETGMYDGKGVVGANPANVLFPSTKSTASPFNTLIHSQHSGPRTRSSTNANTSTWNRKRKLAIVDDTDNTAYGDELPLDLNLPSTLPTLLLSDKISYSMGSTRVEELKRALLESDISRLQDLLVAIENAITSMGMEDFKEEVIPLVDALCNAVYEANISRENSKQVPLSELVLYVLSILPLNECENIIVRVTMFPTTVSSLSFEERMVVLSTIAFNESKHGIKMLGKILQEDVYNKDTFNNIAMDIDLFLIVLQKCVDSSCIFDEDSHSVFAEIIPLLVNFFAESYSPSLSKFSLPTMEKLSYDLGVLISRRLEYTLQWARQFTRIYFSRNSTSGSVLSLIRHVMFCGYEKFPVESLNAVDLYIESIIHEEGGVGGVSATKTESKGRRQKSKLKGRVAAKVEGIDDNDDELEIKSFAKAQRLEIFHMLMLCEQDNMIHRGVDSDGNFGITHLLPWSDMQSASMLFENANTIISGGESGADGNSGANIINHYSTKKGYDQNDVSSDRCCHFDNVVALALHVMKFKRGVARNYELRSKQKSIKAEFVFLEDTNDQTSYIKEASQKIEYIASNFPSLWFRYIPAFLDALKHSLILNHSRKSSSSSSQVLPDHQSNTQRNHVTAQYLENSSGLTALATVSFCFHGSDINEVLWSTIISSLKSIPFSLLQHPSALQFGIDDLNSEIRDLYRKRQLFSSISNLLPSPSTLPPIHVGFPKLTDVALVLYDFIYRYGGSVHESKLYYFYKKYPECKEVLNRYDLKELCAPEHCNGCLRWEGTADESCSISCQSRYTEKLERSIIQIKVKFKELRKAVEGMNCFEMNTKLWLLVESILNDSVKYDMQQLITLYTSKYGFNASLL